MKQTDILKFLAKDLKTKTADLADVNEGLKAKLKVELKSKTTSQKKYRLSGKAIGHYGFTGHIKALTAEGVKVVELKKVTLIPYSAIEKVEIAKPREKRPVRPPEAEEKAKKPAKPLAAKKPKAAATEDDDDDEDDDAFEDEDFDTKPKKSRGSKSRGSSNPTGSKYIPGR